MPMKSGTGEDPFADDPEPTDEEQPDQEQQSPTNDPDPEESTMDSSADETAASVDESPTSTDDEKENDTDEGLNQDDIPWVLRRSRVKDGRPEMIPVYVREETADRESEFMRAVEDAVGKDVYKFDLREAAMLVAMNHPEEVADQLNRWGYEFLD